MSGGSNDFFGRAATIGSTLPFASGLLAIFVTSPWAHRRLDHFQEVGAPIPSPTQTAVEFWTQTPAIALGVVGLLSTAFLFGLALGGMPRLHRWLGVSLLVLLPVLHAVTFVALDVLPRE